MCLRGQVGPSVQQISHNIYNNKKFKTYQVYRIHDYNPGIPLDAPWDAHISIHLPRNSNHILRTTNIQAFDAGYIRARIRKHLLSYTGHVANVCKPLTNVRVREDGWAIAGEAENSERKGQYDAEDNVRDREDSQQQLGLVYRFAHLDGVSCQLLYIKRLFTNLYRVSSPGRS